MRLSMMCSEEVCHGLHLGHSDAQARSRHDVCSLMPQNRRKMLQTGKCSKCQFAMHRMRQGPAVCGPASTRALPVMRAGVYWVVGTPPAAAKRPRPMWPAGSGSAASCSRTGRGYVQRGGCIYVDTPTPNFGWSYPHGYAQPQLWLAIGWSYPRAYAQPRSDWSSAGHIHVDMPTPKFGWSSPRGYAQPRSDWSSAGHIHVDTPNPLEKIRVLTQTHHMRCLTVILSAAAQTMVMISSTHNRYIDHLVLLLLAVFGLVLLMAHQHFPGSRRPCPWPSHQSAGCCSSPSPKDVVV